MLQGHGPFGTQREHLLCPCNWLLRITVTCHCSNTVWLQGTVSRAGVTEDTWISPSLEPIGTGREHPVAAGLPWLLGAPWVAAAISASFTLLYPPFRILWKYKRQLTSWAKKLASIPFAPCTEKLCDVYKCNSFSLVICNPRNGSLSVIYLCLLCSS